MQRITIAAALGSLVWAGSAAMSSESTTTPDSGYLPLGALYALGTKDTDPPPGAKLDRLSLRITGKEAERIYKVMTSPEQRVDCEDQPHENYTRKVAGGFECDKNQGEYSCTVGIDLDTGTAVEGYVCD